VTPPPDSQPNNADLARTLAARLDRFERYAAESMVGWIEAHDLSLAEVRVVLAMADQDPMGGSALAERAGLSVDIVYPAVHSLDARGWIEDQGRVHGLSADGYKAVAELATTRAAAVRNYVDSLSPAERDELATSLGAS
jgi:DNA-binding MarR family transcriptional regulator